MKNKSLIFIVLGILIVFFAIVAIVIATDSNKIDSELVSSSWFKSSSNYSDNLGINLPSELVNNRFIIVKENSIKFCAVNENNKNICNEYESSVKKNKITINLSDDQAITYTYEITNGELTLSYDAGSVVIVDTYVQANG